jgi:serine/threonine protein kinase
MADRVGQQIGNYRLVRWLGQGGFAEVYLGEHLYLDTQVAIKLLHTQLGRDGTEQFRAEARTIAHLEHPHIVRVLDFGVEGNTPYLIMSYAPHGSLRQRHPPGTQLPLEMIVSYVKQIAEALQYAHDQKLIHRDIKPENVLVGRQQEVLLSDFGLVTLSHQTYSLQTGRAAGTLTYMAPEQIQGKPRPASDQYALGIVVYEWLCGIPPFRGEAVHLIYQHVFVPPPSLREKVASIPSAVEQVVMIALAKDPKQRFATVEAFALALKQASLTESLPSPLLSEAAAPSSQAARTAGEALRVSEEDPSTELAVAPGPISSPAPALPAFSAPPQEIPPSALSSPSVSPLPSPREYSRGNSQDASMGSRRSKRVAPVGVIAAIVSVILVVASGGGVYLKIRSDTDRLSATSTIQARQSNFATATTHAQVEATATLNSLFANATATASPIVAARQNRYLQITRGTPFLTDPLSDNTRGYGWSEGEGCMFAGGAYHVSNPTIDYSCSSRSFGFDNLLYQVEVKIIKGDCAGIEANLTMPPSPGEPYGNVPPWLNFCQDGYFQPGTGSYAFSSFIRQGLNQTNLIAILVDGNDIFLYINRQYLGSSQLVLDKKGSTVFEVLVKGEANDLVPTEGVFSNLQVWKL